MSFSMHTHSNTVHVSLYFPRLVCLFLKRGADYNARDKNQKDPITIAVDNANADIVTLCVFESRKKPLLGPCKPVNNSSFSNWSSPFQAADRQDEQGDAGDGRSVWPIRSIRGAGIWGCNGRDWRWAGPHQEKSPGYKEPYKWLGSGGAKWLVGIKTSSGKGLNEPVFGCKTFRHGFVKLLSIRNHWFCSVMWCSSAASAEKWSRPSTRIIQGNMHHLFYDSKKEICLYWVKH